MRKLFREELCLKDREEGGGDSESESPFWSMTMDKIIWLVASGYWLVLFPSSSLFANMAMPVSHSYLRQNWQVLKTWKEFSWQWNQEWLQTMGCRIHCGCQADLKSGSSLTQQQSSRVTTNGTTFQICWLNCLPLHTIVFPRIIPSCKTAVNLSCISFTLQHPSSL